MAVTRAWAWGLVSIRACSMPGSWTSAVKTALPVTLNLASMRGTDLPTTLNSAFTGRVGGSVTGTSRWTVVRPSPGTPSGKVCIRVAAALRFVNFSGPRWGRVVFFLAMA